MASIEERLKRMRNGAGAQKSSSTTVSSKTQKANTKDIQSRLNAMRNSSTPSAYAYSDRAGAIKWEPSSREEKKQLDTARSDVVGRIVPGMMDVRTGGILPRETSKTQPVTLYAQAVSDEERMNSLRQRAASATEATDDEDEILRMAREDPAGLREKIAERVSMSSEAEDLYRKLYPNSGVIDTAKGMGEGLKIGVTKQFPASMAGLATGVHESVGTFLNMINTPVKDGKVEYEDYISPLRDDALRLKEAADAASLANLEGRGPASARLVGVSQAAGNMLPGAAVGGIGGAMTGGALSGLSTALISAGAGGSSYLDAIQQGAGVGEAAAYGILSGATEYFTERLFGGNPLVDTRPGLVNQVVKKLGGSQKLLSFLASQPVETLNEGLEEAISEILNPVWQRLTYDPNADFATLEQIMDSAIDGVLLAGFMQGGSAVMERALRGKSKNTNPTEPQNAIRADATAGANVYSGETASSPVQSNIVREYLNSDVPVTNSQAERIMGDASVMHELGIDTNGKTRAQIRRDVKAKVSEMRAQNTQSLTEQVAQKETELRTNVLDSAKRTMGERGYATFEQAMRDDIDPAVYYRELTRAYNEGLASADRTGSNVVTKVQYDEMYKAGQDDAMASLSAQVKNAGNATTFKNGGIDYADADTNAYVSGALSKETAKALDTVSKALGIKVRFADSVAGGDANAQYANGIVTIEKNNSEPVRFLFSHEITHRMQALAPEEYSRLKASIFSGNEYADALIKDVQDQYAQKGRSISNEDALDEAVANYIGTLLENSGELERFIEKHRADRTLLEKLRDIVRDIVRKLKGTDQENQLSHVEKRLSETLDAAVKQAKKNAKAQKNTTKKSGGEVKFSLKYADAIDQLRNGTLNRSENTHLLVTEHTPQVYIDKAGAKDLKIIMGWDIAYLAMNKNGEIRGNYHGLGADVMKAIPKALEDPLYIVKQSDGRINAVTEIVVKGKRAALVSIELDTYKLTKQDGESEAENYNLIVTVLDAKPNYLQNTVFKGNVVYNKNNEAPAHFILRLKSSEKTVPDNAPAGASGDTVAQKGDSVKLSIKTYTAKELEGRNLTVRNGVIVTDEMAGRMRRGGYFTPNDRDAVRYSIKTEPAWRKNYLAMHPGADAERVAESLKQFTERMIQNDAIFTYVPNGDYDYTKFGPLRGNMEYIYTFDMDTSCPRTFQFLRYRNNLRRIAGRELTYNESVNLLELMRAYGQQIPCAYCYVENKRVLLSASYNNFFGFRQAVMNAATDEEALTKMYSYDAKKGKVSAAAQKVFERWRSDTSYNPSVTEVWTATNEARNGVLNFLDEELKRGKIKTISSAKRLQDLVFSKYGITNEKSPEALEVMSFIEDWRYDTKAGIGHIYNIQNSETVPETIDLKALQLNREALAYSKSASSAKTVENYIPYTDQLKNVSKEDRDYIIGMGGIRKHSSNDFRIDYVQDYFMFYADLAAGKWTGHTYTKSVDFAKIFGRTGDRINMSVAFYGNSKETLRQNLDEGAPWRDVKELRKNYKDVGSMAMVTNDVQLSYAMNSDWIDMIIPFHSSGLDKSVWYDLRMWNDYTSKQSERFKNADDMKAELTEAGISFDKKASADDIRELYNSSFGIKQILTYDKDGNLKVDGKGNPVLHKPHFFPGDTYVDGQLVPGHHNDTKRYFELCREYGVHPRFKGIQVEDSDGNMVDVTDHPGYIKLIKETSRIDSKQRHIEFNLDQYDDFLGMSPMDYAFMRMEEEAKNGGYSNTGNDAYGIVKEFAEEYLGKDRPLGYLTERAKQTQSYINQGYQEMAYENNKAVADTLKEGEKMSLKDSKSLAREIARIQKDGAKNKRSDTEIQADVRAVVQEAYQNMVSEYGAIRTGEKPARDVQVPKRTTPNNRVSQTVRTVMEAGATPDEALPTIEEMTARGDFSYEVYGDEQAISDAREYIGDGWDEAQRKWFADVQNGVVNKRNTAVGWLLYDNAANNGNVQLAMDILNAMVEHQRNAAQAVQATRILKQLSPETQLYGVQRSANRLQRELNDRYKDRRGKVELKIDEDLAKKFMEAQTQEERDEVMKDIYRDIGRQMPSTFMDKWNAWRYLAMLGNVRTHVRNVAGNAFFAPVVAAKDLTATAIESAVYRVSGGKTQRTKGKVNKALLSAAWADYSKVADTVAGGGKYSDLANANRYIEEGRQIFKTKALEKARKANSAALEAEDAWFSKPHYAFAMAQYCQANGITEAQIRSGKGIEEARAYAAKEAQKATYRDTNQFSELVSSIRFKNPNTKAKKAANIVIEGILPFRKTPANILVRGLEYSPIGLLNGIKQAVWDVQRGKMSSAEAIDSISAGLTGTGLMGLGIFLAAQGLIRGHGGDDDDKREFEEMMGHQAYSLELPNGTSVTLDWLAPEALPFFIGVNLWETTQGEDKDVTLASMLSAASTVAEPLLEMSCLQSLNNAFEAVGYATSNDMSGLETVLSAAATSYLTQALPTILGQAERSTEGARMTTYTEKDGFLTSDMQYTLGRASSRIPGLDYQQIPYIDAWGRVEDSGGAIERTLNNFLNPAYMSDIDTSETEAALMALYEQTGDASIFPSRAMKYFKVDGERKDLTAEEYVVYAQEKGQRSYQLVSDLINSSQFNSMSDDKKVKAIRNAYDLANQQAKASVSDYGVDKWVEEAEEAQSKYKISEETYISIKRKAASIESLKDKDGETIANSRSLLIMQEVYNTPGLSEKQRKALFEYLGVGKTVIHYNRSKVNDKLAEMKRMAK